MIEPTPTPRKAKTHSSQRPSATRDRIIEVGTRLIASSGVDAINSNVIARAAGVGVGTFYSHFADKHALHREAMSSAIEGLQGALVAAASRHSADATMETLVRAMVEAAVGFAEQNADLFRVAFVRPPRSSPGGRPSFGLSSRGIESRLQALQREGRLHPGVDPGLAARAFTSMQTSAIVWWLEASERPSRERLVETLVRLHPAIACRPTG